MALLDLLRRRKGLVRVPAGQELRGDLAIDLSAFRLAVGPVGSADADALVPVEPHPRQRIDDRVEGLLGVPGGVGVLDAEDESAAHVARIGVVEQARAHHSHVGGAGRRRAESNADVGARSICDSHDVTRVTPASLPRLCEAAQRRAPSGATAGDGGVRGGEIAGRMRRSVVSAPPGASRRTARPCRSDRAGTV